MTNFKYIGINNIAANISWKRFLFRGPHFVAVRETPANPRAARSCTGCQRPHFLVDVYLSHDIPPDELQGSRYVRNMGALPIPIVKQPPDIVDPEAFLGGCRESLLQYRECLMKNLQDWDRRYRCSVQIQG